MRRVKLFVLVLLAGLVVVSASYAAEPRNHIRILGTWSSATGDFSDAAGKVDFGSAGGLALNYERKVKASFGFGVSWLYTNFNVEGISATSDTESSFKPLLGEVYFHLTKGEKVDFFIGPSVGYVWWGDLEPDGGLKRSIDSDFVLGANLGLDIHLSDAWGLALGLRYLDSSAQIDGGPDVDVSPWVVGVGADYRF